CFYHLRVLFSFPTRRSSDLWRLRKMRIDFLHDLQYSVKGKVLISSRKGGPFHEEKDTGRPGDQRRRLPGLERRHPGRGQGPVPRSEEHTSELQSRFDIVCRL